MIIQKIEIGSFGKLENTVLNLSGGVNIVRGANESGKSTICNFIKFIFYGLPQKPSEKLLYISWRTSCCRGAITFINDDGNVYRAEREVVCARLGDKMTFNERVAVFNVLTNELCFKNQSPGEVFFGVPENVFDSTVYIRQLGGTKTGDKELCESAENILFSGDEGVNTKKALKKLDELRVYLLYKNKKGGQIYETTERSRKLGERLEEAQKTGEEIIYLEGTARQLAEKNAVAVKQADKLREELNEYEAYLIKKAYRRYTEQLAEQKEITAQIEELRRADNFFSKPVYTEEYIAGLEKSKSALEMADARLKEAKKRYDAANKRVYDMKEKIEVFERFGKRDNSRDAFIEEAHDLKSETKKRTTISAVLFGTAILFAVALAAFTVMTILKIMTSPLPFIIASAVLGLGALVWSFVLSVKNKEPRARLKQICNTFGCGSYDELVELVKAASNDEAVMTYITDERDAASGAFKEASDELDKINNGICSELQSANFVIDVNTSSSIDEALKICREQKRTLENLEIRNAEIAKKLDDTETVFSKYDDAFIEGACKREYDEEALEKYDYQGQRHNYDFIVMSVQQQKEKINEIDKRLAYLSASGDRSSDLAAQKAVADNELAALTRQYEATALALEAMNSASGKLRDGLAPKIAATASIIMNKLSAGKYRSLGVDADFGMTFTADSMSHEVDYLSAGTSDIAYISLRIALVDVLYRKSSPPLIFDESFMRMDNDRMENSLNLLFDLGKNGTQSMLFTCHGREENLMKKIGEYTYFTI
ncbi:MAG: AAA family ATPase [Clostridia bacterium]|nr:AAA family ATPase [Clostridia bacterium]